MMYQTTSTLIQPLSCPNNQDHVSSTQNGNETPKSSKPSETYTGKQHEQIMDTPFLHIIIDIT
jgi:hypothetical protein